MTKPLKIGEMARFNAVSIQTLRHYESIGLMTPRFVDCDSHYRYYTIEQSARLDMIQLLKALDFSLAEIKSLLDQQGNSQLISQLLSQKQHDLQQQEHELKYKISLIKRFRHSTSIYQESVHKVAMEFITFPTRYLHTYTIPANIYEINKDKYEFYLREFKNYLTDLGLPPYYFHCVGSLIEKEHFIQRNYFSNELFIFTQQFTHLEPPIKVLPAGTYAVFYCRSFEEELSQLDKFHQQLDAQELQASSDYICEVLYENNFQTNTRDMFIRLQIRVD